MSREALFGLSVLMSFVAFGTFTKLYIWPRRRAAGPRAWARVRPSAWGLVGARQDPRACSSTFPNAAELQWHAGSALHADKSRLAV
jgi:hypothetical protein